jgi:hypothetical protein
MDDPGDSLLLARTEDRKHEYWKAFNHDSFGTLAFQIADHEDLRDWITHGLSDWVVGRVTRTEILPPSGFIRSAAFEMEIEYNTFQQGFDLRDGRRWRDCDGVALVIYGKGQDGVYRVRGYAAPDGKLQSAEWLKGNSTANVQPLKLSVSALFEESERIQEVVLEMVPVLYDYRSSISEQNVKVLLEPSGNFGIPVKR